MLKNMGYILNLILVGGTAFSWTTVYFDFIRFHKIYGTIFRISGCTTPNPIMTPCFYGAIVFAICLYLSISKKYGYLLYLLIAGTLFAWGNFFFEFYKFYFSIGPKVSCSGIITDNVFNTPCFHGALIYLLALTALLIYRRG